MGGSGSGRRWHWGAKDTTEDYRSIDVRRWKRDGLLSPGRQFNWQWSRDGEVKNSITVRTESDGVRLIYRTRSRGQDEWTSKDYPVLLDWTDCHLGGKRPWFLCPALGCGRRVAKLYSNGVFACRQCCDLAYECQRETDYNRMARRADRIRDKLGWEPGILNGDGLKPKGMHWSTFEKLKAQHDAFVQVSLAGMSRAFNFFPD